MHDTSMDSREARGRQTEGRPRRREGGSGRRIPGARGPLALLGALAVCAACLLVALGATTAVAAGSEPVWVADPSTADDYLTMLEPDGTSEGADNGRYAGRVWTDKSVQVARDGSGFDTTFSALGSSRAVNSAVSNPLDVVFIVDVSGSMTYSDGGVNRMEAATAALNSAVKSLMDANPENRVAVTTFSTTSGETPFVPLGHYDDLRFSYSNKKFSVAGGVSGQLDVSGGTNTQQGIFRGTQVLANVEYPTVTVDRTEVRRIPAVVLLSDGAPTYSVATDNWWSPTGSSQMGNGRTPYYGNGMLALMVAGRQKALINNAYGVGAQDPGSCQFLTVRVGSLKDDDLDLANVTLDPAHYLDDGDNAMAKSIRGAWNSYQRGKTPGIRVSKDNTFTLKHPDSDDVSSLAYNDGAYVAGAGDLSDVFQSIITRLQQSVFTPVRDSMGDTATPLVYRDPVGEYLEVKGEAMTLELFGKSYTLTYGGGTWSVPNVEVTHPVYQTAFNLRDSVKVAVGDDGALTCTVAAAALPVRAATVTLESDGRVKSYVTNKDEAAALPLRLRYRVGFKDDVLTNGSVDLSKVDAAYKAAHRTAAGIDFYSNAFTTSDAGAVTADATATFAPSRNNRFYYFQANRPVYGAGTEGVVGSGGAYDSSSVLVTPDDLVDDATYYVVIDYYSQGSDAMVEEVVARTGSELKNSVEVVDGRLVTAVGAPRPGNTNRFTVEKDENETGTAPLSYAPAYDYTAGAAEEYRVVARLGNNGRVTVPETAVRVSKAVTAAEGLAAPDRTFTFDLEMRGRPDGQEALPVYVRASEGDAAGAWVPATNEDGSPLTRTVSWSGGTAQVELSAGQSVVVEASPNTSWTVTEHDPSDGDAPFSLEAVAGSEGVQTSVTERSATGTAQQGAVQEASFTNRYRTTVTWGPDGGSVPVTKTMEGDLSSGEPRGFVAGDRFSFQLSPEQGAPLPRASTADGTAFDVVVASVEVAAVDQDGTLDLRVTYRGADGEATEPKSVMGARSFSAVFPAVEFDAPGTYSYTVSEVPASAADVVAGVTYDGARYRYTVPVNVDGADPTRLSVGGVSVARLDGEAGTPVEDGAASFTNTYDTNQVVRRFGVVKTLTGRHLAADEFSFTLEGTGAHAMTDDEVAGLGDAMDADHAQAYDYDSFDGQPMPQGAHGLTATATNDAAGHVSFGGIPFLAPDASLDENADAALMERGVVYRYRVTENAGNLGGIAYDGETHDVYVYVHVDTDEDGASVLRSQVVYGHNHTVANQVPFENHYTAKGSAQVLGTKAVEGRTLRAGDSFTFSLSEVVDGAERPVSTKTVTVGDGEAGSGSVDFAFDPIDYVLDASQDQTGTHTYVVREVPPEGTDALPSMTYDTEPRTVTVEVSDAGDGTLETAVDTGDDAGRIRWTNRYTAPAASVSLPGTKTLAGSDSIALGLFEFETRETGPDFDVGAEEVTSFITDVSASTSSTTDPATGAMTATAPVPSLLPSRAFAPGEYFFQISEIRGAGGAGLANTVYDPAVYRVHLTVTDEFDGSASTSLEVVRSDDGGATWQPWEGDALAFSNTFEGVPHGVARLSKVTLNAAAPADGYEFRLRLQRQGDDGSWADARVGEARVDGHEPEGDGSYVLRSTDDGTIPMGDLVFLREGTYQTLLTEVVPDGDRVELGGTAAVVGTMAYDTHTASATYRVARDGSSLAVTRTGADTLAFVNDGGIAVSKAVYADDVDDPSTLPQGPFTFQVTGLDEGQTAYLVVDGQATSLANEETFELSGGESGRIYGLGQGAQVTLVESATDGFTPDASTLTATAQAGAAAKDLAFRNKYTPGVAAQTFSVSKELTGRDFLPGETFTFTLAGEGDAPMPAAGGETAAVAENGGSASFGAVTFDKAGTYTYTVREQAGDAGGVTYDGSVYTVTVEVAYDEASQALRSSATFSKDGQAAQPLDGPLAFTNTYDVEPVGVTVTDLVRVSKRLAGRPLAAGEFSFELVDAATDDVVATGKNAADGTVTFDRDLTFSAAGEYTYTVREVKGNLGGVTYDEIVYSIVLTVTDNGNGTLSVTRGEGSPEAVTFENRYSSTGSMDGVASVNVSKVLTGRPLAAGQFTFLVEPADAASAAKLPAQTLTNGGAAAGEPAAATTQDGKALSELFSGVTFDQDDAGTTFSWTVSEKGAAEPAPGYTMDASTHTVTVAVTDDGAGTVTATTSLDGAEVTSGNAEVRFANRYEAESDPDAAEGSGRLVAAKELAGRDLREGEFSFVVRDAAGAEVARAENAADGTVDFGAVRYSATQALADVAAGLATASTDGEGRPVYHYTYTLAELADRLPDNVSAEVAAVTVTVDVTDNGDGTMACAVVWPAEGAPTGFVNAYEADPVSVAVTGSKFFTAADGLSVPDSVAGAFTFTLADESGAVLGTATNDASGQVAFPALTYTQDDLAGEAERTFTYTVTESGSVPGITNDADAARTVTVHLSQGSDGHLSTRVEGVPFTFTNAYGVDELTTSVTDQVPVTKTLTGRTLVSGEFSFELTDAATGAVVATGTNGADGAVVLSPVTYTRPGTYVYGLSEVAGTADGVTYDDAVCTVTTTVTDNGDGTLSATHAVAGGEAVFDNAFTPTPVVDPAFGVAAKKVLVGRDWTAGDAFTFVVEAETENAPMPDPACVVATEASPTGTFGAVSFSEPGTYSYLVSETAGSEESMTYSQALYRVVYEVAKDEATGELSLSTTVTRVKSDDGADVDEACPADAPMEFVNTYEAPAEPGTPAAPSEPAGPGEPSGPAAPVVRPLTAVVAATGDLVAPLVPWLGLAAGGVTCAWALLWRSGGRRRP